MIMWMAYAAVIGVLLAAAAWAGERVCETMGWPRRFPWLVVLALAVVVPLSAGPSAPAFEISAGAPSPITSVVEAVDQPMLSIPGPILDRVAAIGWGAVSLGTLAVFATILGLMARSRRRWSRRAVDGEEVYVSDGFGPALIGVARPAVVVPEWLFCASERAGSVAILHEREHARAGDHLSLLFGALVAALFPWSPAVWWMVRNLRGAVEIDCDRRVIASGIAPDDYGELLLAIGAGQRRHWALTPALIESRHSLERRLKVMAARKMKWNPFKAAGLAGLSLTALLIACDANAPTALDDALAEVLGSPEATEGEAADGETAGEALSRVGRITADTWDGRRPMIFIDGVKIESTSPLGSLDPDNIERIEVIKGSAAAARFGDQAEAGVIQIFTKEPSENDTPSPPDEVENDRSDIQISGTSRTAPLRVARDLAGALRSVEGTLARSSDGINLTIEAAEARFHDADARRIDVVNAVELANGLMRLVGQRESIGTPAPSP